jgi:hypothetical protein
VISVRHEPFCRFRVPQFQGDILIGSTQGIDWRTSACLRHLSNDTRGTSCGCHHVGEGIKWARPFAVWWWRFAVVKIFATGSAFRVSRENSLGCSCDSRYSANGAGRRLGERGCRSKRRRRFVLWAVAGLTVRFC